MGETTEVMAVVLDVTMLALGTNDGREVEELEDDEVVLTEVVVVGAAEVVEVEVDEVVASAVCEARPPCTL